MKLAILSMQKVINFGSVLQAYSLMKILEDEMGIVPYFIDIDEDNKILCNLLIREKEDYMLDAALPAGVYQRIKRKLFREMVKKNNQKIYNFVLKELKMENENQKNRYDCVIVGSDEVFNNTPGIRLQLYGKVEQAEKVISFAASCGMATFDEIPKEYINTVKNALGNFAAMSVRDSGTEDYIGKLYEGKIERHFDPVLMGDLYKRKHRTVPVNRYLVIYAYGQRIRTTEEIEAIKGFAKKNHLKTLAIGGSQFWCDLYIPMSPFRVLDYFYYAEYVITDTFHGIIFSVINHKKFAAIIRKTNSNKMYSLLDDLGLRDRIVNDIRGLEDILVKEIDYSTIDILLERERKSAREYLKKNLEGIV